MAEKVAGLQATMRPLEKLPERVSSVEKAQGDARGADGPPAQAALAARLGSTQAAFDAI